MNAKVTNLARPFNVGDTLMVRDDDSGPQQGQKRYQRLTVASWRPGIDVHAVNGRGQSHTVPWHKAEVGLQSR